MKSIMKLGIFALMVAALALAFGNSAMAVHGSTIVCSSCHTIHNSEDGAEKDTSGPYPSLLLMGNKTDLCLSCHDGTDSLAPDVWDITSPAAYPETPGGDFYRAITGNTGLGHNPYLDIVGNESANIDEDDVAAIELTPPGWGGAALTTWNCVSCHDAHGTVAGSATVYAYRYLLTTVNGVSVDTAIGSVNADKATLGTAEADDNKNIYKNGTTKWGTWCQACHTDFHPGAGATNMHPTAGAMTNVLSSYGSDYSYLYPLVATDETWVPGTASTGVDGDEEVFCLSCHKAHAAANDDILRWDVNGAAGANTNCNKCHRKGN